MTYNYKSNKIVAIISGNLEPWQAMNVLGHLSIALGANKDKELMGREVLIDQKGDAHVGIARFGFIVKKAKSVELTQMLKEAKNVSDLKVIDFPREMLDTRHDDELAESVANKSDFEYLGVLLYGPTEKIDSLTKVFKLW